MHNTAMMPGIGIDSRLSSSFAQLESSVEASLQMLTPIIAVRQHRVEQKSC